MARLSHDASLQIAELARHYAEKQRFDATDNMYDAVDRALVEADRAGARGKSHPAVYRGLARVGVYWIKAHRYWFAYVMESGGAVIVHVFYDTADIPRRLKP